MTGCRSSLTAGDNMMMPTWIAKPSDATNRARFDAEETADQCSDSGSDRAGAVGERVDGRHPPQQFGRRHGLAQRRGADDPEDRSGAEQKEAQRGKHRARHHNRGHDRQRAGEAEDRTNRHHRAKRDSRHDPGGQHCADDHAKAEHAENDADRRRRQTEVVNGVRNEHREDHEKRDVEHELRGEDRREQAMAENECHAVANLLERLARLSHDLDGFRDPGQRDNGKHGQARCQSERSTGPGAADEKPANRRTCRQRGGACQLDSGIGGGKQVGRHKRGHRCGRGDAEQHRSANSDKSQESQQRPAQLVHEAQRQNQDERGKSQQFCAHHQTAARHAVRKHARGYCEQQKWQGQRRLQCAALDAACAEREHRNQRRSGQRNLFGGMRQQVCRRQRRKTSIAPQRRPGICRHDRLLLRPIVKMIRY